ncbi:GHKL domain-containing protein [Desulfitobacterium sp. THU1]|uniref:sensor histidine kinase n=1 Tax=Desulfitobacterium sp. THU1 TaxID=3138072 RepID=UPI00311F487B
MGEDFLYKSYPIITHIPLVILLVCYYKKPINIALVSVLTAYLLCTPRKWFGTIISYFWGYSPDVSYWVQIVITIPLMVLIIKTAAPIIVGLKQEGQKVISLFIYVPLTFYLIAYGITVYSDLLYSGGPAVVEFLDSAIVVVYFLFSVMYLKISKQKRDIARENANLQLLFKQSEFEMSALKETQKAVAIYRHDMRHHLSLIRGYLADGEQQQALDYIQLTQADIEEMTPDRFSNNNTVNLILSSFANKAKTNGVKFIVKANLPPSLPFPETELCALLSNGLENAISAASQVNDEHSRTVRANCQTHKGKLLILIENSYTGQLVMKNGLPQRPDNDSDHGFGTKSIMMIAEKHKGYCSFAANSAIFTLKIVLPLGNG